jgi:hypothetical protein
MDTILRTIVVKPVYMKNVSLEGAISHILTEAGLMDWHIEIVGLPISSERISMSVVMDSVADNIDKIASFYVAQVAYDDTERCIQLQRKE